MVFAWTPSCICPSLKHSKFKNRIHLICILMWNYWPLKLVAYMIFVKNNPFSLKKVKTVSAGLFHKLSYWDDKSFGNISHAFQCFSHSMTYYSFVAYIFLHLANTLCSSFCGYRFPCEKLRDKKKITHLWFLISETLMSNRLLFLLLNSNTWGYYNCTFGKIIF